MSLTLLGFSHKNSPAGLRETLARLSATDLYEKLRGLGFAEAVILSTCNRFEVYLAADGAKPQEAAARVLALLRELSGQALSGEPYVHAGPRAVGHLFEVASGLDSLVVGETEILGQVKSAYEAARAVGMTGKYSNVLFQRALYTGKRARAETGIAAGQTSVASVAVQLAERIFGCLSESQVLILGAGPMAELCAKHLLSKKVSRLLVANRTFERARALCASIGGEAIPWGAFPEALSRVDVVIASTGSERPVVTREAVAPALRGRGGRSLFLIDIAMPRDVEEPVHGLDHVYLYRLEDLEAIVAENIRERSREVERARALAREKAAEFSAWEGSLAEGAEASLRHCRRPAEALE